MSKPEANLLHKLRIPEVVFLSGGPVLGGLFGCERLDWPALGRLVGVAVVCGIGGLHVGIANDFFDTRLGHRRAPEVVPSPLGTGWIVLSFACLAIALALAHMLGVFLVAVGIAAAWMAYVAPPIRGKTIPVLSCVLHFLAGSLQFALGHLALGGTAGECAPLMIFFGLILVSGQLCHEIQHADPDGQLGTMTNARYFGNAKVFCAALVLIVLSDIHLTVLAAIGSFPVWLATSAWGSFAIYLPLWRRARTPELTRESIGSFRRRYRLVYALLGIFFAGYLIAVRWP